MISRGLEYRMFYLPTLCGLEYHMSLGAIDSRDLCLNTVRGSQLYVSYYINLLGAMVSRCICVTLCGPDFHVSYLFNSLWTRLSYFCNVNLRMSYILPLWRLDYHVYSKFRASCVSCINPLWTRLSFVFYVNLLMPRVSCLIY